MSNAEATGPAAGHPLGNLAHSRGWTLAFGIITLLAGIAALTWPGSTVFVIAMIFGIQLVVLGVFWFVNALGSAEKGAQILLAILAILVGALILRNPLETVLVFPLLLGLFWTVNGIIETFHAIARHEVPHRGWSITAGVLSLLAGIALLAMPVIGLVTLTVLLGVWLVIYGAVTTLRGVLMHTHEAPATAAGPAHA